MAGDERESLEADWKEFRQEFTVFSAKVGEALEPIAARLDRISTVLQECIDHLAAHYAENATKPDAVTEEKGGCDACDVR